MSINNPQVLVCPTSVSARAIDSLLSSLLVKGVVLGALPRRATSCRPIAGSAVVALTILVAADVAWALVIPVPEASVGKAPLMIAARTELFRVFRLTIPERRVAVLYVKRSRSGASALFDLK